MIAPKRRVAACIFGLLPRYHFTGSHVEQGTLAVTTAFKADKAEHDFSAERLLQAIVVPSFDQYLVKPNAAGFQVDVFVHNGEARRRSLLLDAWKPQALHVGDEGIDRPVSLPGTNGWPGGATPRMFASIESVLRLKSAAERAQGALYDLVVLMRSDLVWYTPFRFSLLNASYLHTLRAGVTCRAVLLPSTQPFTRRPADPWRLMRMPPECLTFSSRAALRSSIVCLPTSRSTSRRTDFGALRARSITPSWPGGS